MKLIYFLVLVMLIMGCKRYKDPSPFTDSRISKPYCNDPSAINYNWDFPGIPDNSTCIYPAQIFAGNYLFKDSLIDSIGNVMAIDSFPLQIQMVDSSHLQITGFCGSLIHTAKANRFYTFTLDSLVGNGQTYCAGSQDIISGKASKTGIFDSTQFTMQYLLQTSTGSSNHHGTAIKQ